MKTAIFGLAGAVVTGTSFNFKLMDSWLTFRVVSIPICLNREIQKNK